MSLISGLFSFISLLDLFRSPIRIKFEKREKTSTYFGIFFSIGIIVFLSYYFAISDVFRKQTPSIMSLDITNVNRPKVAFSDKLFAVSLTDDAGSAYNDTGYFYFEVTNRHYRAKSNNKGYEEINSVKKTLHSCEPSDFRRNEYDDLGLSGAFCLDDNSFFSEGYWDEEEINYLEINLNVCDNTTMNNTCKPTSDIENYFSGKVINIYYKGVNCDPSNYESPMKPISYNDYYYLDFNIRKWVNVFFKNLDIKTDDGLIVSNFWDQGGSLVDSKEVDIWIYNATSVNKNVLFEYNIYASRNTQKMTRTYQKLLEALSDLGGIANIVMIFGYLLTSIEYSFTIRKKVMNSLYSFQDVDKIKEKIEKCNNLSKVGVELQSRFPKSNEIFTKRISPRPQIHGVKSGLEQHESIILENIEPPNPHRSNTSQSELFHEPNDNEKNIHIAVIPCEVVKEDLSLVLQNIKDEGISSFNEEKKPEKNKTLPNHKFENRVSESPNGKFLTDSQERPLIKKIFPTVREDSSFTKQQPLESFNHKSTLFAKKLRKTDQKLKEYKNYEEYLKKSSSKFTMNFFEYVCLYIKLTFQRNLSQKEELFLKGDGIYEEELDIVHILRKIQEIEKLKLVLLNEDQRLLFNLIDKPMIYLDDQMKSSISSVSKVSRVTHSQIDEKRLRKVFEKISSLQTDELSIIDRRLIDLVEKKLSEYMNNFT